MEGSLFGFNKNEKNRNEKNLIRMRRMDNSHIYCALFNPPSEQSEKIMLLV